MFGRQKVAALAAEFLGTGVLTLLVLSVQRSTIGVPFFVAAAAGLTVALLVLVFGGISGGYFNPAITLALWTARKVSALQGVLYIVMQFLGAWGAYYLYAFYVKSSLQPVGGHFTSRILVAEAVGTFIFALGLAAAIYQAYSRAVTATVYGLAYMLGIIAASSAAIGLLNPAVAFGVKAWVLGTYVLGPVLGAVIGVNLFGLVFAEPEALGATSAARTNGASVTAKKPVAQRSVKKPVARKKK